MLLKGAVKPAGSQSNQIPGVQLAFHCINYETVSIIMSCNMPDITKIINKEPT